jgi:hypothetical protein
MPAYFEGGVKKFPAKQINGEGSPSFFALSGRGARLDNALLKQVCYGQSDLSPQHVQEKIN